MVPPVIKRVVPASVRSALRALSRELRFRSAVRALVRLPEGGAPDRALVERLLDGWGNSGYAADVDFDLAVAGYAAEVRRPVLECGSGLTTILLAALAGRRGVRVRTLEHDTAWLARVRAALAAAGLDRFVELVHAPLRSYGDFSWYEVSFGEAERYSLVVCDGPPGDTPGGRFGLVPVLGDHLAADATILLDDADRSEERTAMARWATGWGLRASVRSSAEGTFATLRRPRPATA